jgi:hypothetical protein
MTDRPIASDIEFNALRNALYHTARRQRLETWARILNFATVVGGAGTIVAVTDAMPATWKAGIWLGVLITIVGALQLVFDFSGRARTHELLQRRYYDVLSRVKEAGELSAETCSSLAAEISRISGEEPPTLRALDAVAFNEATDTLWGDDGTPYRLKVSFWQNLTKHLLHHNGVAFEPIGRRLTVGG